MAFDFLLLPLIGGFVLVSHWHRTAYYLSRADRTRLFFYSALAGVVLLATSRLLVLFVGSLGSPVLAWLTEAWKDFAPFAYSGTSVSALMLGMLSPLLLNWLDRESQLEITRRYVDEHGSALERFLVLASEKAERDEGSLVMLSLDDRKVYVGWVERLPTNPDQPDSYLRFVPLMSGYRDAVTLECKFMTFYDEVIRRHAEGVGMENSFEEFVRIIPLHAIKSASFFRRELFDMFPDA